jgi:NAD(P)H-hydrate repair Nnr-like enzyme with NAD(P)H-hydrate dehydratase domain
MLLLVGAVPIRGLPLSAGEISLKNHGVTVDGRTLDIDRGTAAMITVVCTVCQEFGLESPVGIIAGDMGTRDGSISIYNYLEERLPDLDVSVLTFHYIMPDIKKNKRVLARIDTLKKRPVLIADAGSMYVAKAGGDATRYDIFTPDLGETAYLADERAPHPTYTRGFIFHLEDDVPELIRRAYETGNAARTLFVKGAVDYICQDSQIIDKITEPCIEEMEPIGGTGDLITGVISGLVYAGKSPLEACRIAGRVNRRAGELCRPNPATQVDEVIKFIPQALDEVLKVHG